MYIYMYIYIHAYRENICTHVRAIEAVTIIRSAQEQYG